MSSEEETFTNELINESSPYLLQHAHNPVNWYPWGEKALKKAKEENKLIIVSIGYAACHWCHVMEHESFEDSLVAATMNEKYISIKVDREERPDVDQVYMDAAQLMTGSGGWPLNIIALPDGRPVFAGTYFAKDKWIQVLTNVGNVYLKNPDKVVAQAEKVQEGVAQNNLLTPVDTLVEYDFDSLDAVVDNTWLAALDMNKGGRKGQMKFPTPLAYNALLKYAYQSNNKEAVDAVMVTLNNMLMGGIYDQVGGGFARYSVDPNWDVPHFEKMLYDNAQLIWLYSEAYKFSNNQDFKRVVEETVAFSVRELKDKTGMFYSSLDADSDGEEGKFYVWTEEELQEVLGEKASIIFDFYSVTDRGNWEDDKNVLRLHTLLDDFAKQNNISSDKLLTELNEAKNKLLNRREDRIRPALDDKMLTSWNALMISGLKHAYEAFGDKSYLSLAEECGNFLYENLWDGKNLKRNYKNDKASINGFIDDYGFSIQAFIHLYEATFDEIWLHRANELTKTVLENFSDTKTGLFSFKSNTDEKLYTDKTQIDDSVIPSGNSTMAHNLFQLGHYLYNESYLEKAQSMLSVVKDRVSQHPTYYYNWFDLYRVLSKEPYEVAIVGNDAENIRKEMASQFLPQTMLLGGVEEGSLELLQLKKVEGKTMIYVCQNKSCKLPVTNVDAAIMQMR